MFVRTKNDGSQVLQTGIRSLFSRVTFGAFPEFHVQVNAAAFAALEECVSSADFDACERVPSGGDRVLINPLGGAAVDLDSPFG